MTIHRFMVALAVTALLFATAYAAQSAAAPKTAVAVVDLDRVFKESKSAKELNADNQMQIQGVQEKVNELREAVNKKQQNLEFLVDKESDAYRKAMEDFEQSAMELQVWTEFQKRKMLRMQTVNIELLYRHVQSSVEQVAKRNGYDLVIFDDQAMDLPSGAPDALMAQIAQRKLLYHRDEIDITDQVIQDMNSRRLASE